MESQVKRLYEFGPFQLDLDNRLLTRDGRLVPLSPKVFDTLLALVENRGRVLAKDELMQLIWPNTYVEESNLTHNISQIRRILGDGEYIQTFPRRGYRFVFPVLAVRGEASPVEMIETAGEISGVEGVVLNAADGAGTAAGAIDVDAGSRSEIASSPASARSQAEAHRPGVKALRAAPGFKRGVMMLGVLLACASLLAAAFVAASRRANAHADIAFRRIKLRKIATAGEPLHIAVSHDGRYIAYVEREGARQSLWIRQVVAASSVQVLAPAEVVYKGVTFSPDDGFLYYVARQKGETSGSLYQIPALGGLPKQMMSDVDSPIALAPDGQFLAFVRDDPARGEMSLITVRPDGSNERRLLTRKRPETLTRYAPAWSPDGKVIACPAGRIAGVESTVGILAVNVVDGSAHLLGERKWTFIGQIAWLGDGSGVVFNAWNWDSAVYGDPLWLSSYPKGEARLITNSLTNYEGISVSSDSGSLVSRSIEQVSRMWIAPVTGAGPDFSRAKQLPFDLNENFSGEFGLDWAPGGQLIYASQAGGNLDIWAIDPNDSRQKQLTGDALTDTLPAASADGRHIVFVSDRSGYGNIWRMDIDGGNPKQLTRGKGDFFPALSPDGKWVVFSSWDGGEPALWKVSIDGGEPVRLVRGVYSRPVISPDGKWISYFNRNEKGNKGRIALLPFAGGEPKFLETVSEPDFRLIRWLPDGRALTYIVTRDGVSNLWSLPIDGGAEKQLTQFTADRIFRFAWSPDGKTLAYERGSVINEVVLISGVP